MISLCAFPFVVKEEREWSRMIILQNVWDVQIPTGLFCSRNEDRPNHRLLHTRGGKLTSREDRDASESGRKWVATGCALLTSARTLPFRFSASHEQNKKDYGAWRGHLHQRLCDHTHVLPITVVHAHREVCAQPQRLHEQWELLFPLVAGDARASDLRCASEQHWLQNR